ncbi:hypothetical protein BU26DRAFT_561002 [Trematosphaeria pertusa]|uniref:Uncharacterized protein n=1 Tax=Trematosphaeria pertusa TaxID=390896 RepID=A0A6A6ITJ8_9PLEO|nr:uncharacterized protein BU26DRAFT_561002 [Trematosphaeria pertusa]KAF2253726.1 hypothetical protein BU26DRAFT_561002 [Trematosphaeria pertusa]
MRFVLPLALALLMLTPAKGVVLPETETVPRNLTAHFEDHAIKTSTHKLSKRSFWPLCTREDEIVTDIIEKWGEERLYCELPSHWSPGKSFSHQDCFCKPKMAPIWKDFMDGAIDNCEGNWRGQTDTVAVFLTYRGATCRDYWNPIPKGRINTHELAPNDPIREILSLGFPDGGKDIKPGRRWAA